jgi:hypothetical protein
MIKFFARRKIIKNLKNGYTLIRASYGHYFIQNSRGDIEIVPLWLGFELWNNNIVEPILDIKTWNPGSLVFRLVKP